MRMLFCIFFLFSFFYTNVSLDTSFFRNWQCIGIKQNIDFSKPYTIQIGDLPLVLWEDKINKQLISTINICKHMGSKLDNGVITETGCLKCQYHGLEMSSLDKFGEIVEHEGKIFWAYDPIHKKPFSIPFFHNANYEKSFLQIDMDGSLTDSAYNTMDLRHPEYVHNSLFGFGSSRPPQNIKSYKYLEGDRVGLSFDYYSNPVIRSMNDNIKITHNFHMYIYPTFTWSKVSFQKKNLIIGVNLLPLSENKTRWYITLLHNYYTSPMGKNLMQVLASTILSQDFVQMKNQAQENELKKTVLFNHIFKDEEVIVSLKDMFSKYKFPNLSMCTDLYKNYMKR